MNQPSLFEDPRIHRPSDPATSKAAAREVEPKLESKRGQMLFVWRRISGTANEIAIEAQRQFGGNVETLRKRKAELRKAGLIRLLGVRRCMVTGKQAEVYEGCPIAKT